MSDVDVATMSEPRVQQVAFRAMGSEMLAAVDSDEPRAGALPSEVPAWFAEWEQTLSRFKEDSELSRLNRAGGSSPVPVSDTRSVGLPAGVRLDFGGVAKGWAADEAASRLGEYGPALVDAGGDVAVSGPMRDGTGWPIGIEAPLIPAFEPGTQLELLLLPSGG